MKKREIYAITKRLRKHWEPLDDQVVNEANPDELLVELSFTMRCLMDITELMLQDEDEE